MDSPLAQYLRSELKARGKSLYFLAEFTGLDIRYLHRLTTGQKRNPSAETLVKIAFALVASEEQFRRDPRLPLVLSELLLAAGYTAVAAAPRL
jgi:transcriptional regulator with XRE-family HTH domain